MNLPDWLAVLLFISVLWVGSLILMVWLRLRALRLRRQDDIVRGLSRHDNRVSQMRNRRDKN